MRLGLRENLPQFSLLVLLNAFVGAMVGLERTVLPLLGEQDFGLSSKTAITSFIVSFGVTKAVLNLFAARLSDRIGRKPILVAGWLLALPVPFLIILAPAWWWIDLANVLLGANQAMAWSMTVIMKIDLVGPRRRGLALGLNEFAGYFAVGVTSWVTGYIAAHSALRPQPFYLGIAIALVGLGLSLLLVRETLGYVALEAGTARSAPGARPPTLGRIFRMTSLGNPSLLAACQAGLVNNLNDGMAWGLFPLFFAAHGLGVQRIGLVKAVYPAVWGLLQVVTGPLSDRVGRKGLIAWGMVVQAGGIWLTVLVPRFDAWIAGAVLQGLGTAMVYPTLLAAITDHAHPTWRASSLGVYRFWRDLGYAVGALLSGLVADLVGLGAAIHVVAALTLGSGLVVARLMAAPRPAPVALPAQP
ncbi:MAG: MFS transporter [Candidatus Rokubacteria bacterium RBG_16_73_20]|nr:MAG: MFS transporter [Candidatus Rokubacteria bacterium GWA2_73_35]OGK89916.1 MAG: MFS transporter [Candidatus Rokubacteria bacterium GWF2_70_14]OGK95406.1 MAG: MFS transporter [Candidatus Rokubacteria bacterium RBG_16_73_20]